MKANGEELPIDLNTEHFATLMGWLRPGASPKLRRVTLRRARRWLERNGIGWRSGRDIRWTISDLRQQTPSLLEELISRGTLEP